MNKTIRYILLLIICFGILILFLSSSFFAELNQDEGWYLYAARLVSQGEKPFVDFAYTQGPIMCYVYSIFTPLINNGGIFAGRIITAIFGITATILSAYFSTRFVKTESKFNAFIITLALCGMNLFYISFCTIVKTYALCACFIMAGLICLTYLKNSKKDWTFLLLSGIFLGLATSVRVSAGIALPIIFFGLLIKELKLKKQLVKSLTEPLLFAVGAGLTGAIVFLPLYIKSPDAFKFFVFEYHAARAVPEFFTLLAYKIGFLSRFFAGTLVASILIITAIIIKICKLKPNIKNSCFAFTISWIVLLGITIIHFSAAFPYDDYQIIVYPLMTSIATTAILNLFSEKTQVNALTYNILIVTAIFALSSPKLQEWFIVRDKIWWPIKKEYPLQTLKKAANTINELKTNNLLLTQDAYLAIETGMDLPDNMALGPFSYYPDMPTEKAQTLHVLNKQMLVEMLNTTHASVAAISEYGFAIESPNVSPTAFYEKQEFLNIINSRYNQIETIPHFGQAYTELNIYKLK